MNRDDASPARLPAIDCAPVIPDHQLLRCIGRGSYGEVWLARNLMGAYRAVKVVYRQTFDHQRPFDRELTGIRKFEPVSRSHEGFVDVLHVGNNELAGYFYYIMELGDDLNAGQTIDPDNYVAKTLAKIAALKGRLSTDESLQLGLSLTKALGHLHQQGLVHRDIKPSNIIFVNDVPKLADIGMVAHVDDARSYVGTEGFIPPDGPGTPQADIYSLGKVLYEISTGKDRHEFPELPTLLDEIPDTERFLELNEVILHACNGEIARRYQTASDMHADLVVLSSGKSVKRLRLLERRLANLRRVTGLVGVVAIVLAALGYQIYRELSLARESKQRQVGSRVAYGIGAMEAGKLQEALPALVEALQLDRTDRQTGHRVRIRAVMEQSPKLAQIWFGNRRVNDAAFSPDGQRVVIAEWFGKARVYDAATGQALSPFFGPSDGLVRASFDPTGHFVVTASQNDNGTAEVWKADTGEKVLEFTHPGRVYCAAFSPDGSQIITGCKDKVARVWDLNSRSVVQELVGHRDAVLHSAFSPDGRFIATGSTDGTARLWDAKTGRPIGRVLEHAKWVTCVAFSPDSRRMIAAGLDNKASVWEVSSGKKILPDLKHADGLYSAEFSPDGLLIATSSLDGTVRLWDAITLQPLPLNPVIKHNSRVLRAAFSPDGCRLISGCLDGTTRIWDLAGSSVIPIVWNGSISQDGSRRLIASNDTIQIWDTSFTNQKARVIGTGVMIQESKLSRDGKFALTLGSVRGMSDATVLDLWDVEMQARVSRQLPFTNSLSQVCLSDDGRLLAIVTDRTVLLKTVTNGIPKRLLSESSLSNAVFSPDARLLAASSDTYVYVWDTSTGQQTFQPLRHVSPVSFVSFSPDGRRLVTGSRDRVLTQCSARVWNALTGQPVGPPLSHGDGVLWAAISPDGRKVITASEDSTAVLWNVESGKPLATLHHSGQVRWAAFSPDGRWVVTASSDRAARVWDGESGEPITPPLPHPEGLSFASFNGDLQYLVTANAYGRIWLWNISADPRSTDDLVTLSQLLAGYPDHTSSQGGGPTINQRQATWNRLKTQFPDNFKAAGEEIDAWHLRQVNSSQSEKHWSSAVFHLRRLLELRPDDTALMHRLQEAKEQLDETVNQ